MQYSELKEMLIEYMENGVTINLKSMVNSIFLCTDVEEVRLAITGFSYYSFNDLRKRSATYLYSYMNDCNKVPIFNNRALLVIGKDCRSLGDIWFGRDDLLSLMRERDRYGNEIPVLNGYAINWDTDNVYLISVADSVVDANAIFGSI